MMNKLIVNARNFFSGTSDLRYIPGIAWFFILLFLLLLPGGELPESNEWLNKIFFDKWVHAGLFGLLALLFIAPVMTSYLPMFNKWIISISIAAAISAWGLATEFIQHACVIGRSFDIFDWLADTVGAILAVFIGRYLFLNPSQR